MLERAGLARPLGLEERQLAAPRVRADEREAVGAVDHVHAEMGDREVGDLVARVRPEGDVVERQRLHGRERYPPAAGSPCDLFVRLVRIALERRREL